MKNNTAWTRFTIENDDPYEKRNVLQNKKQREKHNRSQEKKARVIYDTESFKCRQCGFFVTVNREISGVNNRNHCPRCLYSRHVDLFTPGDRRADCMSRMGPIGLTQKQVQKRYGSKDQGELMLVHRCTGCGKYSINRIAADDDERCIHNMFLESWKLPQEEKKQLELVGIHVLGIDDLPMVYDQLFGRTIDFQGTWDEENTPFETNIVLE